jgi:arsenite methyltransferase
MREDHLRELKFKERLCNGLIKGERMDANQIKDQVKDYYGKTIQSTKDLKTNACCTVTSYPRHIKVAMGKISDEVLKKYYGCGLTIPTQISGLRVLDLGCGAGRDCYLLSQLVGENGQVVGVDMTPEQLEVANNNIEFHREKFKYKKSNVEFMEGDIQALQNTNLESNSFDLIISNCVVNLVPNKEAVLSGVYNLLKQGGEFYFSDVYCNRRIPESLMKDPELWGECLSGAMYWNDFENLSKKIGFADPRVVESAPITINNNKLGNKLDGYEFYSVTYRLFKIDGLEPFCEDYGQAIIYKGGIEEQPQHFILDNHHLFKKGKVEPVCGNTYLMLKNTRYTNHFEFVGNFETHYGIFEGCGITAPFTQETNSSQISSGACC